MSSKTETEQLVTEIHKALNSGSWHSFPDDIYELDEAIIYEDVQLLRAFLPLVGKLRFKNLKEAKAILVSHGYADYGKYLTFESMRVCFDLITLTFMRLGPTRRDELCVLALTSTDANRDKILRLVEDRDILDVEAIKRVLASMDDAPDGLSSGVL